MLTNKQAISKIKKEFKKNFDELDENINYYTDYESDKVYEWRFEKNRQQYKIVCNKETGETRTIKK